MPKEDGLCAIMIEKRLLTLLAEYLKSRKGTLKLTLAIHTNLVSLATPDIAKMVKD